MTLTTRKTPAYGLWEACGRREDGGLVEALGRTPERAQRFAAVRAADWSKCDGCGRVNVRPAEAAVSRRAYRGRVLCACCQNGSGPDADLEREAVYEL